MSDKQKDAPTTNKKVHPPVVALLFIILAIIMGRFVPIPLGAPALVRNLGLGLMFIGFLFGMGAFLEFRKARTTLDPHGSTKALVTGGVYKITRNPIYLGFLFMVIGFPLTYGFYWGIIFAPLYAATMNKLVIEKEEAYLESKFKGEYTGYRSRVRRWL